MTIELLAAQSVPIGVLSLNPAVDITYEFPRLLANQKVHALATRYDPGGNGVNVGRALHRLQTPAQNYCVLAGEIGKLLKRLIVNELDDVHYVEVAGETRINGTFIGQSPHIQYEVSGIGPDIPPDVLATLLDSFVEHSARGFGVLTGSLQQALPATLYAELACRIAQRGGRAVIDSRRESLRHAIDARPFLIKPNRYELETLLESPLGSIEAVASAARKLQRHGVEYVCVSLDADGALLVGPDNSYHAAAQTVEVLSSVGAGDSMVAALVAAFARGARAQDALRLAVACATGTVMQPGTELFFAADVDNRFENIALNTLDI